MIRWFRVIDPTATTLGDHRDMIVCERCLTKFRYTLLNRVFGSSQECNVCGCTDRKGKK